MDPDLIIYNFDLENIRSKKLENISEDIDLIKQIPIEIDHKERSIRVTNRSGNNIEYYVTDMTNIRGVPGKAYSDTDIYRVFVRKEDQLVQILFKKSKIADRSMIKEWSAFTQGGYGYEKIPTSEARLPDNYE
jgi:hypothetical protein